MRCSAFSCVVFFSIVIALGALPETVGAQSAQPTGGTVGVPASGIEAPGLETPVPFGAGAGFEPGSALEAAVSGDEYTLGPGDLLSVSIWGPQSFTYSLPVTLEGQVLIPTMGPLSVDRLSLTDAKQKIKGRILRDFRNVEVTVSLVRLRKFQIHVLGQVSRPGTYLGSAVDRASTAVGWAGGLTDDGSQRRILIRNQEGVRAEADLFAFLQRGIETDNPTLKDGDVVYVPFDTESFSISGAVHQSGPIEFVPGDRLSDAIFFAGGLRQVAQLDTLELVRYDAEERNGTRFFVLGTGEILLAPSNDLVPRIEAPVALGPFVPAGGGVVLESGTTFPDFELQPRDMVLIRERARAGLRNLVQVLGEVSLPGYYPILEGETRLSDVLEWAGGITGEAFLAESYVARQLPRGRQDREYERLSSMTVTEMTTDEYEYFKVRTREKPGRMVVDFDEVLLGGDSDHNILLQSGDEIRLGRKRDFVSVIGLAAEPGNVPFDASLKIFDYIDRAGGYAEDADAGKTRVIRAGTGEWVPIGDANQLNPGDTIWIPEEQERDYWVIFKDVLSVTAQILTVYLIVDRAVE